MNETQNALFRQLLENEQKNNQQQIDRLDRKINAELGDINRNIINKYDEDILEIKIEMKNNKDSLQKQIMEGRIY